MKLISAFIIGALLAASSAIASESASPVPGSTCDSEQRAVSSIEGSEKHFICINGVLKDMAQVEMATLTISKHNLQNQLLMEIKSASIIGLPVAHAQSEDNYIFTVLATVNSFTETDEAVVKIALRDDKWRFKLDEVRFPLNKPTLFAKDNAGAEYRITVNR